MPSAEEIAIFILLLRSERDLSRLPDYFLAALSAK